MHPGTHVVKEDTKGVTRAFRCRTAGRRLYTSAGVGNPKFDLFLNSPGQKILVVPILLGQFQHCCEVYL